MEGPLEGTRVLELATGIAGPYAGRLLAMLGAQVRKLEPSWGDPARSTPVDDEPVDGDGALFIHLSRDKQILGRDSETIRAGLLWADIVIDDRTRYQLDETELSPEVMVLTHPGLVFVSVTAYGFEALEQGRVTDELLVQARSGVMTVTGDPDAPPLRFPGWQSQYMAGAYAAACALACLARDDGAFHHVDVAWLTAMASGTEAGLARTLQTGRDGQPAGPRSLRTFPSGAWPCADGHVVPGTVRRKDWELQCEMYGMPELVRDERFKAGVLRGQNHEELEALLRPWYTRRTKRQIFEDALPRGLALGMVVTPSDVPGDRHMAARGFLHDDGVPSRLAVWTPQPDAPGDGPDGQSTRAARTDDPATLPLDGVRVLELCTAWAGPFIGRFLGALGADVVKVESVRQPDGWRLPQPFKAGMARLPDDVDPDEISFEVAPNFNALNRNKRGICVDLTTPKGREIALSLAADCDIVTCNFTARVLPSLGLGYDDLRKVNPDVVLLTMPALGASGPYRQAAGYGTIVEGMGGFASRFGYRDEPARVSDTYYPDAVAGVHATVAVLGGLRDLRVTGRGCCIDLSQQEVMWLCFGETILEAARRGTDPSRLGNGEPGCAVSGVYRCADGAWVAIVARDDIEVSALQSLIGVEPTRTRSRDEIDEIVASWTSRQSARRVEAAVEAAGVGVSPVRTYAAVAADPWFEHLQAIETVYHPVTGPTPSLRIPIRIDHAVVPSHRPAPRFDEHTDEVLVQHAGLTAAQVAALREEGVVGGRPGTR